jgi:hypothetical protein
VLGGVVVCCEVVVVVVVVVVVSCAPATAGSAIMHAMIATHRDIFMCVPLSIFRKLLFMSLGLLAGRT